mmetsp:Transcript_52693/g.87556  ORF Transcript_52693/g.87556 Transcript_52693/m.87556 type:complete len:87 (-) Transcript_52693:131-391(-)
MCSPFRIYLTSCFQPARHLSGMAHHKKVHQSLNFRASNLYENGLAFICGSGIKQTSGIAMLCCLHIAPSFRTNAFTQLHEKVIRSS